jgi:hypothetical protein
MEAARRMAALSPETQRYFDECVAIGGSVTDAFRAIGAAIGSKRCPIPDADKRKLFGLAEQFLKQGSDEVANAVATGMLEQLWTAARGSGFDLSTIDPFLGPEARGYLLAWDAFNKTRTPGLRPR